MHVQYCIQSTLTLIPKVRYLTVSTVPYGMAQVCHIRYLYLYLSRISTLQPLCRVCQGCCGLHHRRPMARTEGICISFHYCTEYVRYLIPSGCPWGGWKAGTTWLETLDTGYYYCCYPYLIIVIYHCTSMIVTCHLQARCSKEKETTKLKRRRQLMVRYQTTKLPTYFRVVSTKT